MAPKRFMASKCCLKRRLTEKFGYLILRKITKFVATRCQILRLHQIQVRSPRPLAGFKGPISKGREGKGWRMRWEREGEGMEERRGEGKEGRRREGTEEKEGKGRLSR